MSTSSAADPPVAPIVSIVVPTYGRAPRLPRLVEALAAQTGAPPFELVVVDDASPDETPEMLAGVARSAPFPVFCLRQDRNRGPAAARNAGWRAARGEIVAFTDDDCVPMLAWLREIVAAFEETGADVVQGTTFPDAGQHAHLGPFAYTLRVQRASPWFETCNIAYRRSWLERLGGFDEGYRYPAGEDTDLGWRAREAGATVAFAPRATVLHDVHPATFLRRVRDTGRWEGVVRSVRDHPDLRDAVFWRWFWKPSHPPALVAAVGMAASTALVATAPDRWPVALAVAVGGAVPYGVFRVLLRRLPGRLRAFPAIPLALVVDLAEVVTMARASVRYRTLLL